MNLEVNDLHQEEQIMEILHMLRRCGHYLHHHWGCGRGSQFRALRILTEDGEITQRQLQDRMGIQQGSLSEVVKKLEDQALITRTCAPEDHRQLLIRITEQGRSLEEEHHRRRQAEGRELLAALSGEEQCQLRELLGKLLASWAGRQEEERR